MRLCSREYLREVVSGWPEVSPYDEVSLLSRDHNAMWRWLTKGEVHKFKGSNSSATMVKRKFYWIFELVSRHTITLRNDDTRYNTVDLDYAREIHHGVPLHPTEVIAQLF
ncbi:hypothetical protein LINPERHAP2_LOCUS40198 [Linum perenne]